MKPSTLGRMFFLAGMLVGTAALADPELARCVDPAGQVTLTDAPCQERDEAAPAEPVPAATVSAADPADPAMSKTPAARPRAQISPAAAARQGEWARNALAGHGLSPDAETLKAARLNLQMRDDVALARRQQRLAGRN